MSKYPSGSFIILYDAVTTADGQHIVSVMDVTSMAICGDCWVNFYSSRIREDLNVDFGKVTRKYLTKSQMERMATGYRYAVGRNEHAEYARGIQSTISVIS